MKFSKKLFTVFLLSVIFLLGACGNNTGETGSSEEESSKGSDETLVIYTNANGDAVVNGL